jgi:hypothetical protein
MENKQALGMLETKLSDIEKGINEAITFSLEIIKSDPSLEKQILLMFVTASTKITDYFIRETENTGTEHVGKSVIKYVMFKKF